MVIMLTERQADLFRRVVDHYVETASPISSATLVKRDELPLSSATVRSELAEMEELGLVFRPHTSAGVVPSESGYRYYVEALVGQRVLSETERQTIRHQFHQVELEESGWVRLAGAMLAQMASSLAVITPIRTNSSRLLAVDLIPLTETRIILVEVLDGGRVQRASIDLPSPVAPEALQRMGRHLSDIHSGRSPGEIRTASTGALNAIEVLIMDIALEIMDRADRAVGEGPFVYGFSQVMSQPEFEDSATIRGLLEALDAGTLVAALHPPDLRIGDVRVVIGHEHDESFLHPYGAVVATYGEAATGRGTIAVMGPTRMPYSSAIPSVRYVAHVLSEIVIEQAHSEPQSADRNQSTN
jgi:heat-inducible transcriptional repressor